MKNIHTAQDIFDTVATHLLTQGKRSVNEAGGCAYRGVNGQMCAIGVLIPDELYSAERMEGQDVTMVIKECVTGDMELATVLNNNLKLCNELQLLHDQVTPIVWQSRLYRIARRYNFDTTAIDELNTVGIQLTGLCRRIMRTRRIHFA